MHNFTKLILMAALVACSTAAASAQQLLDNFENTRQLDYPTPQGTITAVANPASAAPNTSATVGKYDRDGSMPYATVSMQVKNAAKFANVSAYVAGTKQITMLFRNPAGTAVPVQLVLQNRAKAIVTPYVYPQGNFSGVFNATSTTATGWQQLTFTYAGAQSDPTVTATDIDQIAMLIAPNSSSAATFYFDDVMGPELLAVAPPTNTAVRQLYDNYEGTRAIKYIAYKSSGGLKLDTLNNSVSAGNTSAHVARYTRSTNQYDALVMQPRGAALADVTNFKNNSATALHMTMKVFSQAPGIAFQITLQDSTVAGANNYPAGRNSEYTATTTATNAWETLTFNYSATPSGTANTSVNEIVLLVSSGTFTRRKVYLDDFYGPSLVGYVPTATRTVSTDFAAFAPAYPNPTSGITQLPFSLKQAATVSLAVYDNLGRRVTELLSNEQRPAGQHVAELNAAKLAPGLYTCRLTVNGVALSRSLSVE